MGLHPKGFDLSLDRITRLLAILGDPQEKLPPVIHVAGTNGKGSVTAFCRAFWRPAATAPMSIHRRIWSIGTSVIASVSKGGRGAAGR
jgi:folylpolyglutamate synthase/dihydropteroate synthase